MTQLLPHRGFGRGWTGDRAGRLPCGAAALVMAAALAGSALAQAGPAQTGPAPVADTAADSTAVSTPAAPWNEEWSARIDAIAQEALAKSGAVGLSVAVGRGGKVPLARGYGLAELEHRAPADDQTMFRIGSITKQYTAAIILQLAEEGSLALSDPITRFLPDYPTQGKTITIHHLLNHTSGIRSYTSLGPEWIKTIGLELSHEEMLKMFADRPFDFEPGENFLYNNSGYYLLGMIIEKVTGMSYAKALEERLCAPLGLKRTRYDSNREVIANRAQGYGFEKGTIVNDLPMGVSQPGAAGAIIASAGDLVTWQLALTGGKVLSADSFNAMCTPTILPSGKNTQYGYGLMSGTFEGHRVIDHGGGIFGFNSLMRWFPDDDLHIAVISNSEAVASGKVLDSIARAVLGIETSAVQDLALSGEQMKTYLGEFIFETIPLRIRFFDRDGQVWAQATGQPEIRLLFQGDHEFRAEFDTDVRMVFSADGGSFMLHQNGAELPAKRAAAQQP